MRKEYVLLNLHSCPSIITEIRTTTYRHMRLEDIIESILSESIIWLAETARGHLNSCPKQEKLHQVAQGPIQLNFHYLQGWWLDNFSGNLFQLLISCGYMLTSASFWMSYTYRSVASILFYGFGFLLASPRMQQPLTSDWFSQCQRRTRMVTLKLEQGIYMHLN